MKQRNLKVYAPIALFLLLFLVDKIALIPAFQNCCTVAGSSHFFQTAMSYNFDQQSMIDQAGADKRRLAMNFGTSRSLPYYSSPNPAQAAASPYLSENQKQLVSEWEVVNSAFPGSSIVTSYVRLTQWLEYGAEPEVIFVELSPSGLSSRTLWFSTELLHGVPARFVLEHFGDIPYDHTRKILGSRLFQLARYRVGTSSIDFTIFDQMVRQANDNIESRPNEINHYDGTQVGDEDFTRNAYFVLIADRLAPPVLGNYSIEAEMRKYVFLIIKEAQARNIPVVFWNPPTHPTWQAYVNKLVDPEEWQNFVYDVEDAGARYIDLNKDVELNCQRFIDPVHFTASCVPEIYAQKLRFFAGE